MTLPDFFIIGFIIDILITIGWYALEKKWIIVSAVSTMLQTVLGYTIFYNLFPEGSLSLELFIFALGGGVGVACVVILKKYQKQIARPFRGWFKK